MEAPLAHLIVVVCTAGAVVAARVSWNGRSGAGLPLPGVGAGLLAVAATWWRFELWAPAGAVGAAAAAEPVGRAARREKAEGAA